MAQVIRRAQGVLRYDPFLRDFVFNANGSAQEVHPVDQKVAILLEMPLGEFLPDTTVGNPVREIKRIHNDVEDEVIDAVRRCLKDVINAGDIELLDVVVEPSKNPTSRLFLGVFYRNLRLKTPNTQSVQVNLLWRISRVT